MTDQETYNRDLILWRRQTVKLIKGKIKMLGIKGKAALIRQAASEKAISSLLERIEKEGELNLDVRPGKTYKDYGEIVGLGFSIPKHGIMISRGAGKGHKAANPRQKIDFFDSIIDNRMSMLADIVAKYDADKVVKMIDFNKKQKING